MTALVLILALLGQVSSTNSAVTTTGPVTGAVTAVTSADSSLSVATTTTTPLITCATAASGQKGCLTAADWVTFNAKQATVSATAPVSFSANTISMAAATTSVNGYLTSTDWTTFNSKQATVSASAPLVISANNLTCTAATGSVAGCLAAADFTTFNGKQAAIGSATYFANGNPFTLTSVYVNALASAATFGGHKLPAHAFTVTNVQAYCSVVSSGSGSTIIRVSDGTNNCDATYSCTADTNSTGALIKAPSGTCAFAANAALVVSISSTTCATTKPTFKNIDVEGNWQ